MSTTQVVAKTRLGSEVFKQCGLVLLDFFTITLNGKGEPILAEADFYGNPIVRRIIIDDPDILCIFEISDNNWVINMNRLDNPVQMFMYEATRPLDKDDNGEDPIHESWETVRIVYWRDVLAERRQARDEKLKREAEKSERRRKERTSKYPEGWNTNTGVRKTPDGKTGVRTGLKNLYDPSWDWAPMGSDVMYHISYGAPSRADYTWDANNSSGPTQGAQGTTQSAIKERKDPVTGNLREDPSSTIPEQQTDRAFLARTLPAPSHPAEVSVRKDTAQSSRPILVPFSPQREQQPQRPAQAIPTGIEPRTVAEQSQRAPPSARNAHNSSRENPTTLEPSTMRRPGKRSAPSTEASSTPLRKQKRPFQQSPNLESLEWPDDIIPSGYAAKKARSLLVNGMAFLIDETDQQRYMYLVRIRRKETMKDAAAREEYLAELEAFVREHGLVDLYN